jgi:hypothetical protein
MLKGNRWIGLLAAALLVAGVAYAGDVWKDKDYQNWDEKDIQKILNDSPWVHPLQFGGGGSGAMAAPLSAAGSDAAHDGGMSTGTGGHGLSAGNGTAATQGMGPAMAYKVMWYSSRTVREALARGKELNGTPADEARKGLDTASDTYEIAIMGQNLMAYSRAGEDNLKSHAYLMSKKTHDKIEPSKVTVQKGGDGMRAIAIIYDFPKTTAAGAPTIAKDDKGVEFDAKAGQADVKMSFDLSKMADKQGPDY